MKREAPKRPTWIARRYTSLAILIALLPAGLVAAVALLLLRSGPSFEQQVAQPVRDDAVRLFHEVLAADAARLDERLCRVSAQAKVLAAYSAAVLKAPAAYTPHAPAVATKPGAPPPKAVENPVYYVKGDDGALRKPVNDKLSAIFFRARPAAAAFTEYESQQLYATAVLDPLLKNAVDSDALVASAYIATKSGLLRAYPWADVNHWDGALDPLAKLTMCAYSKDKAGPDNVVWTKPYESKLPQRAAEVASGKDEVLGAWAVACIAPITVEGKVIGVAGCELNLGQLAAVMSNADARRTAMFWLAHPEGMLLAAQEGAVAKLGAAPLANAPLASSGNIQEKAYKAALTVPETSDIALTWSELGTAGVRQIPRNTAGIIVGKAKLPTVGWDLGGTISATSLGEVESYLSQANAATMPALGLILAILVLAIGLAALLAGMEARRIAHPLAILAGQVRSVINTGVKTAIATDDDGEIGMLSKSVQELVDIACSKAQPINTAAAMAEAAPGMPENQVLAADTATETPPPPA